MQPSKLAVVKCVLAKYQLPGKDRQLKQLQPENHLGNWMTDNNSLMKQLSFNSD